MKNLLKETIEELELYGKTGADVLWVGRDYIVYERYHDSTRVTYKSTWEDFCSKADFEYDDGYGSPEIPTDLIIVGKDFWLERGEYDGSEWWEFKTMPEEPTETRELMFNRH